MEVKTTLYTHMKEQIDSIKDENIRLSEKLHVKKILRLSRLTLSFVA